MSVLLTLVVNVSVSAGVNPLTPRHRLDHCCRESKREQREQWMRE